MNNNTASASGYSNCACRDCFEIAVSDDMSDPDLCNDCEAAGCSRGGDDGCCREEDEPDYDDRCMRADAAE